MNHCTKGFVLRYFILEVRVVLYALRNGIPLLKRLNVQITLVVKTSLSGFDIIVVAVVGHQLQYD